MPDTLGYRKRIGLVVPSTNTTVQPETDAMRVPGVTCHTGRVTIIERPLNTEQAFNEHMQMMRDGMGMNPAQAAEVFKAWNKGPLNSYLIEIAGHVLDAKDAPTGGPLVDYAGSNLGGTSFSLPRNKATTTLEWNIASVRSALTWYHTGGYDQKASTAASAVQSRVDAYEQFDLYAGWSSSSNNLTVYTKVENLFDELPPHDAAFRGSGPAEGSR